mgnify:CR=1 FL=1
MDRLITLFFAFLTAIILLILGGVFAEPIARSIRRRIPNFSYEGEGFMIWGALVLAAFAFGMVMMYLLH